MASLACRRAWLSSTAAPPAVRTGVVTLFYTRLFQSNQYRERCSKARAKTFRSPKQSAGPGAAPSRRRAASGGRPAYGPRPSRQQGQARTQSPPRRRRRNRLREVRAGEAGTFLPAQRQEVALRADGAETLTLARPLGRALGRATGPGALLGSHLGEPGRLAGMKPESGAEGRREESSPRAQVRAPAQVTGLCGQIPAGGPWTRAAWARTHAGD